MNPIFYILMIVGLTVSLFTFSAWLLGADPLFGFECGSIMSVILVMAMFILFLASGTCVKRY